jgi:hypothetical protein
MGEVAALRKLRRQHGDEPLVSLLIDAAILHTKADLRLLELAETGADQLAQADAQQENSGSEHDAAAG